MAKRSYSCSNTKTVTLKRKGGRPFLRDGKPVTFKARLGGSENCPKIPPTAAQRAQRKLFKQAASACGRKKKTMHGKELAVCVRNNIGYSQIKLKRG